MIPDPRFPKPVALFNATRACTALNNATRACTALNNATRACVNPEYYCII
jgi:hypothetical protein